jgi:hypothetical protein
MNNQLPSHLRDALNGSFRLPQPQIHRIGAKTEVRESANDEHTLRRESSGTGPADCARMVCSCCDWCGPWREQSDDNLETNLLADKRGHREDVQQRWLPIVERTPVGSPQRDGDTK